MNAATIARAVRLASAAFLIAESETLLANTVTCGYAAARHERAAAYHRMRGVAALLNAARAGVQVIDTLGEEATP